ncbi:MAG: amidohydrolase [Bacteroidota bacterium]|nr:amidohydrolase [Bacteroidota bacterium]
MEELNIRELVSLRKEIHKHPELSGEEGGTAERIMNYLRSYPPDELIHGIGGNSIAAVYKGREEGPGILLRCDLDALPIYEVNEMDYRSVYDGKGHKCGHDGHMAIISGVAQLLSRKRPERGSVTLLYQAEEETGQGAAKVLKDPKFKKLHVDHAFALHNLPGYPHGEIVLRKQNFASASKGMIIKLKGKSSHAGEPQNGLNPAPAVAEIITAFNRLSQNEEVFRDFSLITLIHILVGEVAFGTNPGDAKVMATLRTYRNDDMKIMTRETRQIALGIAEQHGLKYDFSYVEEFPATINNGEMVKMLEDIAKENKQAFTYREQPFTWSEDFGHFTNHYTGALFGLGSGKDQPQLHNPDYDFPDNIIEDGVKMFYGIYNKRLNHSAKK